MLFWLDANLGTALIHYIFILKSRAQLLCSLSKKALFLSPLTQVEMASYESVFDEQLQSRVQRSDHDKTPMKLSNKPAFVSASVQTSKYVEVHA